MKPSAMFPLGMPLLPGASMPLQVFEPRYLRMVDDLEAAPTRPMTFGVTMIERGREVGGGDQRSDVGVVADVVQLQRAGGRVLLVARGGRRVRVRRWLADDPYPRAELEDWPDDTATEAHREHLAGLVQRAEHLQAAAAEWSGGVQPRRIAVDPDPALGLYQLAAVMPIGPADRHRVLSCASLDERCQVLENVMDDAMAVLQFRQS